MRNDYRFLFLLNSVAVLSCKHVDFTLIHPQLADVSLDEKDVRALHARVEYIAGWHVVTLSASHDLRALFNTCNIEFTRNIDHERPVLFGASVDLI